MATLMKSVLCSQRQHESDKFQEWCHRIGERPRPHRKQWEFCFIAQALEERGMLQPGRRGLGFGVGVEPLVSLFASRGCEIVATDMAPDTELAAAWAGTNEHARNIDALNERGLCEPEQFRRNVRLRYVDMNHIPFEMRGFDFSWSACCFEHLGSIDKGRRFINRMVRCLKPGGIGVHTTEFNLGSDTETIEEGGTVLFRKCDIEAIVSDLRADGHEIEVDYTEGDGPFDKHIDEPPYKSEPHLRLRLYQYTTTSIGLIVHKSKRYRPGMLAGDLAGAAVRTFWRRAAS